MNFVLSPVVNVHVSFKKFKLDYKAEDWFSSWPLFGVFGHKVRIVSVPCYLLCIVYHAAVLFIIVYRG